MSVRAEEIEAVARALAANDLRDASDNAERNAILGDAYNDAERAIAALDRVRAESRTGSDGRELRGTHSEMPDRGSLPCGWCHGEGAVRDAEGKLGEDCPRCGGRSRLDADVDVCPRCEESFRAGTEHRCPTGEEPVPTASGREHEAGIEREFQKVMDDQAHRINEQEARISQLVAELARVRAENARLHVCVTEQRETLARVRAERDEARALAEARAEDGSGYKFVSLQRDEALARAEAAEAERDRVAEEKVAEVVAFIEQESTSMPVGVPGGEGRGNALRQIAEMVAVAFGSVAGDANAAALDALADHPKPGKIGSAGDANEEGRK